MSYCDKELWSKLTAEAEDELCDERQLRHNLAELECRDDWDDFNGIFWRLNEHDLGILSDMKADGELNHRLLRAYNRYLENMEANGDDV